MPEDDSNPDHLAQVHAQYILIDDNFKRICEDQRAIVESCEDSTLLSKASTHLPRLS